jgi:hypothetical protein
MLTITRGLKKFSGPPLKLFWPFHIEIFAATSGAGRLDQGPAE